MKTIFGNKAFLVASIALLVIAIQTVSGGGMGLDIAPGEPSFRYYFPKTYIGLDIVPGNVEIEQGSTVDYNIMIYNYQSRLDCFVIMVIPESCDPDWFDLGQNEVYIPRYGEGRISLNVTPDEAGEFKFKVKVISGNGFNTYREVQITVKGPNQPPVEPCLSYPTPNGIPELAAGAAIKLNGFAVDPDGDTLYYRYQLKGPTTKWKSSDDNVISYLDADKYIGQKKTVEGTIVKTYKYIGGDIIFLNFHDPYQDYFTAVIWSSDWDKFPFAPEVYYKGKEVRVTGEIIEYKGSSEIVVRDPSQIEVAYITNNSWAIMRDWGTDNTWTWKTDIADIGDNKISMWIRDTYHAPADSYDLEIVCDYRIS